MIDIKELVERLREAHDQENGRGGPGLYIHHNLYGVAAEALTTLSSEVERMTQSILRCTDLDEAKNRAHAMLAILHPPPPACAALGKDTPND